MSSSTIIPVAEYIATSYRPDCDYIDGELQERSLGETEHSILQAAITAWFWNHQQEWGIQVRPEQRVQVSPCRFRVPDVCLVEGSHRREPILTTPPLVCIELLSKDDTLRSMRDRVNDYLNFGTGHIWILDPASREAFVCTRTGFNRPHAGQLQVPDTPIFLPLNDTFSALD